MKKFFLLIVLGCFSFFSFIQNSFAGSTQVEGIGTRPLSMGGAFIAVADSPEAVFYNPAGIVQTDTFSTSSGAIYIAPMSKYKHASNGVKSRSDQTAIAPFSFTTTPVYGPLYAGIGVYAPFAKELDYSADNIGGFGNSYALAIRTDYTPVAAYKFNDQLSVGAGFVISEGVSKQTIQTSYGSNIHITDEVDGWGYSGIVGLLYRVNDRLSIGGVYRGRMDILQKGYREHPLYPAGGLSSSANIKYPASGGLGIAYKILDNLTLAVDIDWNDWSYYNEVVVKIPGQPDSTTKINGYDTVDYHVGLEYKPTDDTAFRIGAMHVPAAVPSKYILPQIPDYDKAFAVTFGLSHFWKGFEFGLLYEYAFSNEWDVKDNIYGYNGRYEFTMHEIGLNMRYTF